MLWEKVRMVVEREFLDAFNEKRGLGKGSYPCC